SGVRERGHWLIGAAGRDDREAAALDADDVATGERFHPSKTIRCAKEYGRAWRTKEWCAASPGDASSLGAVSVRFNSLHQSSSFGGCAVELDRPAAERVSR